MMKGKTNNPNGRPKGTPNKTTTEIKEILTKFIGDNVDGIQEAYDSLEPEKKIQLFEKLLKYILPTQSATKAEINIDTITDDQIDQIINNINLD